MGHIAHCFEQHSTLRLDAGIAAVSNLLWRSNLISLCLTRSAELLEGKGADEEWFAAYEKIEGLALTLRYPSQARVHRTFLASYRRRNGTVQGCLRLTISLSEGESVPKAIFLTEY
jgi:hypothetical protein